MKTIILLIICLIPLVLHAAEDIQVEFDEAHINMSTKSDSSWNFMDVILYLTGDGLKNVKWYYEPVYTKADSENSSLQESGNKKAELRLWRLKEIEGDKSKYRLWERFKAPTRKDQYLYIEGYVEVYEGSGVNNIIEINDYLANSGKIIDSPLFKKHKIEFSYLTKDDLIELKKKTEHQEKDTESLKGFADLFVHAFKDMFGFNDTDLTFVIKGNGDKIINIILLNERGETIETNSHSISRDEKSGIIRYGVNYKKMLPYKGKIKVYIDDGKGIRKVPFKFQVKLP